MEWSSKDLSFELLYIKIRASWKFLGPPYLLGSCQLRKANFDWPLAQGKSLPPAGIETGTFGLQRSRVSHVIHCDSKTQFSIRVPIIELTVCIIVFAVAICPAAGQIAFETFFCYLSGGRTNSLKWYQMLFVRLPINRIWKLFDWPCSCRHVIVLYCNLMGYPSNLVRTGGGGGGGGGILKNMKMSTFKY